MTCRAKLARLNRTPLHGSHDFDTYHLYSQERVALFKTSDNSSLHYRNGMKDLGDFHSNPSLTGLLPHLDEADTLINQLCNTSPPPVFEHDQEPSRPVQKSRPEPPCHFKSTYYYHRHDTEFQAPPCTPSPRPRRRPLRDHLRILLADLISLVVSTTLVAILVALSFAQDAPSYPFRYFVRLLHLPILQDPADDPSDPNEAITREEGCYAHRWGYHWEEHHIVTEDGFILKMYRVGRVASSTPMLPPILIVHGLFQCSGAFVCNERESLAFWLADRGYDVWLGNNRGVDAYTDRGHLDLHPRDPEYWDWGLRELGEKDWPAMVDAVRTWTGREKIAFVGHSQGNAQGFIGLSLSPNMAKKLSCFVALAPAVFSGGLEKTFPFKQIANFERSRFEFIFATSAFMPLMHPTQYFFPPAIFSILAYQMFAYLFSWHDTYWLRRRKIKYFQFTPRSTSARLLRDWMDGWGRKGVCAFVNGEGVEADGIDGDERKKVPFGVFYGTEDHLVDAGRLVKLFESNGQKEACRPAFVDCLDLIKVVSVEGYEHMDVVWARDSNETVFGGVEQILKGAAW
ncbi:Alpha/Beta hydrolase protein [Jimgerdemannia flammicorona]|uniref:Alpha/Beta hydrolase protein n=1 Tax=Jimgerdemannia flammicorona TaxID=994334 RepID=A0A433DHT4_9FUNG|nr:Alpha/Beta hydrolase protein [Jimgerdemannia flammicorona]